MEDQKLCKTCQDWLKKKYGDNAYSPPYQHCHHPEPMCLCEKDGKSKYIRGITRFYANGVEPWEHVVELKECPFCGRKLNDIKSV